MATARRTKTRTKPRTKARALTPARAKSRAKKPAPRRAPVTTPGPERRAPAAVDVRAMDLLRAWSPSRYSTRT
jgi:hypothetical protein